MSNEFEKVAGAVGHAIKEGAEAVVDGIESPFKFIVKADHVMQTIIKDEPELKTLLTTMVQKSEELESTVIKAVEDKGLNWQEDADTVTAVRAYFSWFKGSVVPEIEKVYTELKAEPAEPTA